MPDPIERLLALDDATLHDGRVGLLCNQTSFSPSRGRYLFDLLDQRGVLRRVFAPEHGLFAELQDQVPLSDTGVYADLGLSAEVVSLYGADESSLAASFDLLDDLDCLVVDVQDVGARYYTFCTTLSYVFDTVAAAGGRLHAVVIDRPNPAGRQVEGTRLAPELASFVGRPGLPHRHGLTVGELAGWLARETGADIDLEVIEIRPDDPAPDCVAPSPNMPSRATALVYSGQCLLEGTNLSEGRGTTRPFSTFGAPWLAWTQRSEPPRARGATLRPTRFVPAFHKHAGRLCYGFELHPQPGYRSLAHSLDLIRWIREGSGSDFAWRTEAYEFRSDRPAIELLAGDAVLLDYLHGRVSREMLHAHLRSEQLAWIGAADAFRRYDEPFC